MKDNNSFFKEDFSNSKSNNFDQILAGSTCITTPTTTWSGKPSTREVCFDDFAGDSSGSILIGALLAAFVIIILYLTRKNNNNLGNFKDVFKNINPSLNERQNESSLTDLLEKLKESYFPTLSISESFIKGNYVILKDLSGKILSESNIKGNYVILTDLNGKIISEVKFNSVDSQPSDDYSKVKSINSVDSQPSDDYSKLKSINLKEFGESDLIHFIRVLKKGEFPTASLLKTEITSDYIIVKDSNGDVLSEIKISDIKNY